MIFKVIYTNLNFIEGRGTREGALRSHCGYCQATGTGTWDLGPGTWDLEPGTWDLGPGTWDLGPGTWDMGIE